MTGGTIADPRVLRTHRALHDAMVALCLEVGYRSITIDQLVERAGTTRATFYTHFRDKEHLLAAIAAQVVADVLDRFEQQDGAAPVDRLHVLFEDAERHPERLRVVLRGEGDGVALRLFTERVVDVITEIDEAARANGAMPLAVDAELAVRAMAGQIIEVLRWWTDIDTPDFTRLPIDEVVAQLRAVANLGRLSTSDPRRVTIHHEETSP
ncbi:MAG: TetR/AcrR family transcriptional regulator [Actinomycetota bacterium]|nr:TetR/AcrR family transcriptional regulator [Actinomycetota bacterium]